MPRRKRNAGDIDGRATSPQLERAAGTRTTLASSTTPRKSKRTRIISPSAIPSHDDVLDDSASSLDEQPDDKLPPLSTSLPPTEPEPNTEPESSIPPHIRRLIKGKQVQRHALSSSGFIDMTSHLHSPLPPLPADSDTDESSFWSGADTSMSSNTSALLSDTSMNVRMDVVRFDWPGSSKPGPSHQQPSDKNHKIHRVRSAPNISPDRFISRHAVEDDTILHRSAKSTPRSIKLARHLGFVIGDGQSFTSSEGKFEEKLRRARCQSNASVVGDGNTPIDESVSFVRRATAAAIVQPEEPSARPSTRIGSLSMRPASPMQPQVQSSDPGGRIALAVTARSTSPNPFHPSIPNNSITSRRPTLYHSVSETSLNDTTSRLSLNSENSFRVSSPGTPIRASTFSTSTRFPETPLRQLPHERALLLRSASTLISPSPYLPSDVVGFGASGVAMSWGMGVGTSSGSTGMRRRTITGTTAPSPSSRYHMQRAPIHVYDAPEILEDYYASPFAWNHSISDYTLDQQPVKLPLRSKHGLSANLSRHSGSNSASDSTLSSAREDQPGGIFACALGSAVFFSRVSGSRLLNIEQLCGLGPGRGLQSAVEWGTRVGGWEHALAVGQTDGGLAIWNVSTKQEVTRLRAPNPLQHSTHNDLSPNPSQVCAMSWNRTLLAAGLNGSALLWDMRASGAGSRVENNERAAFRLTAHGTNKVCGVRWRQDGELLATSGDDNVVCVWDMRMPKKPMLSSNDAGVDENTGSARFPARRPVWKKKKHASAVKALAWCPWAPNILASGGGKSDGTVCFWNAQTGTLKEMLPLGSQITSIFFSPVCREIVTTHGFRAPSSLSNSPAPGPAHFQTYDPHGDPPLLQDTANSIVTHAYPSLARVAHVPNLHGMRISHASLSPDGSRLMTGGTFEALVMWGVWGTTAKQEESGIGSFVGMIR